jgi:hypothetical protein
MRLWYNISIKHKTESTKKPNGIQDEKCVLRIED